MNVLTDKQMKQIKAGNGELTGIVNIGGNGNVGGGTLSPVVPPLSLAKGKGNPVGMI